MTNSILERAGEIVARTGMTQRELSEKMFLDETKLSKALSGVRKFSTVELASLAELGQTTVDWLLTGREPRRIGFAFRAATGDASTKFNEEFADEVETLVERRESLTDLQALQPLTELDPPAAQPMFVAWGEEAATWASKRLEAPVETYSTPQLIDAIESSFDVDVMVQNLPDNCDGASYSDHHARIVVLQCTWNAPRQRFTLAHELGHLLHGDSKGQLLTEQVKFGASNPTPEKRANAFASRFLMPTDAVRNLIGDRLVADAFSEFVRHFKVSPAAASWRLRKLYPAQESAIALLSKKTFNQCLLETTHEAAAEADAAGAEAERNRRPKRLVMATLRAHREGRIGVRPLAQVMGVSVEDARMRVCADH